MGSNISLCSGYGGLDIAVERLTGNRTTVYAENDPAAAKVMAARFPGAVNLGDLTVIDWAAVAGQYDIDSLSAGFSCQDISNAGPREGISGERSKIWKDVCRAIRDIRPRHAFLENVAAIRSRGLDVVAEDLASIGYDLGWTTLRASDLGAAHQRHRWFGIAVPHASGFGRPSRGAEPAQQQGEVRRASGDGGELPAHSDGPRLEVGSVEPARGQLQAAERSGPAAEDPHGAAGDERRRAASGQASRGGAWANP